MSSRENRNMLSNVTGCRDCSKNVHFGVFHLLSPDLLSYNSSQAYKWYYSYTCPNIVFDGDLNLPDIDWYSHSLISRADSTMHNLFLDFIECKKLLQLAKQPTQ